MITYTTGDIFKANTEAIVNPVNCVGVMGKGLALEFKKRFPYNYHEYKIQCANDLLEIGLMLITGPYVESDGKLFANYPMYIINFPTKKDWRDPSKMIYIDEGLIDLANTIEEYEIKSIAFPALGAGNGGLNWNFVKSIVEYRLRNSTAEIIIYNPL